MKAGVVVAIFSIFFGGLVLLLQESTFTQEQSLEHLRSQQYNDLPIQSPRVVGIALKIFATVLRTPVVGDFILFHLKKNNQFHQVRRLAAALPDIAMYLPVQPPSDAMKQKEQLLANTFSLTELAKQTSLSIPAQKFRHWSIRDYTGRYEAHELTPTQVAKALIQLIQHSDTRSQPLRAFIAINVDDLLAQAIASTERYRAGKPLGVLDGVPIAVKDGLDVRGYRTTKGTSFIGNLTGVAEEDSLSVARLRASGAMIIGKANMHEIGIGTTGVNVHHGSARNPYNKNYHTGGSSSGSAAAVASGLVPLAVGTDGGGSIRIPASLCGVVGLKATHSRIADIVKVAPSVGHVGPIAASARDTAIAYSIMAGANPAIPTSLMQPPPHAASFEDIKDLKGIRIGIFQDQFEDARPDIVEKAKTALHLFESLGAATKKLSFPHLQEIKLAHAATILTEMSSAMDNYFGHVKEFSQETQISMLLGRSLSSRDFLAAQKVRAYSNRLLNKVFQDVDILISPAAGITAPRFHDDTKEYGNLNGIPGIVFPVGYDSQGLPIGLLVQARQWDENVLFRIAHIAEKLLPEGMLKPSVYYSVIDEAKKH